MRQQLGTSKIGGEQGLITVPLGSDARDHLIGRRDMLVGLWAAELLGLPGGEPRDVCDGGDGGWPFGIRT